MFLGSTGVVPTITSPCTLWSAMSGVLAVQPLGRAGTPHRVDAHGREVCTVQCVHYDTLSV